MSKKKNYRAMYNQNAAVVDETMLNPIPEEEPITVAEPVDLTEQCKFVTGEVTGCARLNVRVNPETMADVICVIPVYSEIQVCMTHDFGDWYHICTAAGQEGYCMKQFITLK